MPLSRGLGPVRFKALLARNAKLRALVRDDVRIDPAEVRDAVDEVGYGARVVARIIVTSTEREAAAIRQRLLLDPNYLSERFAAEVMKNSRDDSAQRGGLLAPPSVADATYPPIMRKALGSLRPGELGPVIALDRGYAILLVVEAVAPRDAPRTRR